MTETAGQSDRPRMGRLGWGLLATCWACNCDDSGLAVLSPEIDAEPNPLAVGTTYVGLTASAKQTIKNIGSAELEITQIEIEEGSSPGLSVPNEQFQLAPAGREELLVRIDAATIGPIEGAVLVSSNDASTPVLRIPITAVGARRTGPALAVCVQSQDLGLARTCDLPLRVDFGMAGVGASAEAEIELKSIGDQPVMVISAEAQPGSDSSFRFLPAMTATTLAPDAVQTVAVTLVPTNEGPLSAVFQVVSNDPERDLVPVIFNAIGTRSGLCVDPAAIDFGTTNVGQSASRPVTISNCGLTDLDLLEVAIDSGAEFAVAALAGPVHLTPGATQVVDVAYAPVDVGLDRGRFVARADVGEAFVSLRGQTAACDLSASPSALSFGSVGIGDTRDREVLLENRGSVDCHVGFIGVATGTEFSTLSSPPTLTPGSSAVVTVTYAPTDMGTDTDALIVSSDDPDSPEIRIPLDGRRREIGECELTAVPDPVSFGLVTLGTSRTLPVTVTNTGMRGCTIFMVGMAAGGSGAFSAAGMPTLPLLLAGQSFVVTVAFQPITAGPDAGLLEIRTGLTAPPTTIPVTGTGTGARLCATPNPVVFGSHPLGSTTTRSVNLIACGNETVQITAATLAPPTSGEYQLAAPLTLPVTLAAGASLLVDLRYQGVDLGRDDGIFRLVSNDAIEPTQDVQLVAATGEACGDVVGRICGIDGSGPAPGATVWVDTAAGRVQTITDAQGDFVLTCLPVGGVTINAQGGSWSTSFPATVMDQTVTTIPGQMCLDPNSAEVAVVWGEWDHIEGILQTINVPYTFYDETGQANLLHDAAEMALYDVIFLNCGFNETLLDTQGITNLRDFVANGGSVYASDWAYDAIELSWPMYVDFYQDDTVLYDARDAGSFNGLVTVADATLRSALGGRGSVSISSCCTGIDGAGSGTTVFLEGDRYSDGGTHPFFVGFVPSAGAGTVMYTDFHNTGQADIETVFRWLINRL